MHPSERGAFNNQYIFGNFSEWITALPTLHSNPNTYIYIYVHSYAYIHTYIFMYVFTIEAIWKSYACVRACFVFQRLWTHSLCVHYKLALKALTSLRQHELRVWLAASWMANHLPIRFRADYFSFFMVFKWRLINYRNIYGE